MSQALVDVRVVDLSRMLPGPMASSILRDMGATVIRVEHEAGMDSLRSWTLGGKAPDGQSIAYHALNRGKASVRIDLKTPSGHEQMLKLLSSADVLIESFRPGVMANLGLAPESLHDHFPRLIICSISGYGQTHPDRLRAGHDLGYMARIGALSLSETPVVSPAQFADIAGGTWPAVCQILAVLYARKKTGGGALIDVSMAHCSRALLALQFCGDDSQVDRGRFMLSGALPCYTIYATSDGGHVAVAALEPPYWRRLIAALNLPADCIDISTPELAKAVRARLRVRFLQHDTKYWEEFCESKDLMCEIVRRPNDPIARSYGGEGVSVVIGGKTVTLPSPPLDATICPGVRAPASRLGDDTSAILSRL